MPKKLTRSAPLVPASEYSEQIRATLGQVEAIATRVEELMSRSSDAEATFLGGSLLPVMTYALLHQARQETEESVSHLETSEPEDVVDHTDFYAAAVGEMAALIKILATMELDGDAALREDWERLADDLQVLATRVQRATEKFEDALDAAEPEGGGGFVSLESLKQSPKKPN